MVVVASRFVVASKFVVAGFIRLDRRSALNRINAVTTNDNRERGMIRMPTREFQARFEAAKRKVSPVAVVCAIFRTRLIRATSAASPIPVRSMMIIPLSDSPPRYRCERYSQSSSFHSAATLFQHR